MLKIYIENKGVIYQPIVLDNVQLTSTREGYPTKLEFRLYKDDIINIVEGNNVSLSKFGVNMFSGYIFKKSRTKDNIIMVTAYDQIRYLKNKDTYNFAYVTASDILNRVAKDFDINIGEIESTNYVIQSQIEENQTLIDMIQNAINTTYDNTGKLYVLYDDFGKLTLKSTSNMVKNVLVTDEQAKDYNYESSIDDDTYNKVKLLYDDEKSGVRKVFTKVDDENVKCWGLLQYFDKLDEIENADLKAKSLLEKYNKKTRTLTLTDVIGDTSIRAGCMIYVKLSLGDILLSNLMLVEKCTHKFSEDVHLMDITLKGGEINA